MATIQIPTVYRGHTSREASVEVAGSTLGECLDAADVIHPGFRALVVDETGTTHKFNKIFLNGELLPRGPEAMALAVEKDAEIEVMAAIAGG